MEARNPLELTPSLLTDELDTQVLWMSEQPVPAALAGRLRERGLTLRRKNHYDRAPVLRVATVEASSNPVPADLTGARLVVAWPDAGEADALAEALRGRGAEVVISSTSPTSLHRARALAPDALLIAPDDLFGAGWSTVESFWDDPQLRWTPVLLTPPERLVDATLVAPELGDVAEAVSALRQQALQLEQQVASSRQLEIPLDWLGPVQTLRILADSGRQFRVTYRTADAVMDLDVAQRRVRGARGRLREQKEPTLFGWHALAALTGLEHGRVVVQAVPGSELTDIDVSLDAALEAIRSDARLNAPLRTGRRRKVTLPPVLPSIEAVLEARNTNTVRVPPSSPSAIRLRRSLRAPLEAARQMRSVLTLVGLGLGGGLKTTSLRFVGAMMAGLFLGTLTAVVWGSARQSATPPVAAPMKAAPLKAPVALSGAATVEPTRRKKQPRRAPRVEQLPVKPLQAQPLTGTEPPLEADALQVEFSPPEPVEVDSQPAAAPPKRKARPAVRPGKKSVKKPVKNPGKNRTARAQTFVDKGFARLRQGRPKAAKANFRRALQLRPGMPRALNGLTRAHMRLRHHENALRTAKLLVRKRPGPAVHHLLLGDANWAVGHKNAARRAYRRAASKGNLAARKRLQRRR